jgi:translation initiation factor 1
MAKKRGAEPPAQEPFHAPFSGLADRLGMTAAPAAPAPEERAPAPRAPARAVVRLERKGRGGKEATVVEQLDLEAGELRSWLAELKAALGCGGAVEGAALALQGDQRARVKELLLRRGVRKVTLG